MGNVWRITSFSGGKERGSMVCIKGGPGKIDYRLGGGGVFRILQNLRLDFIATKPKFSKPLPPR